MSRDTQRRPTEFHAVPRGYVDGHGYLHTHAADPTPHAERVDIVQQRSRSGGE